MNGYMTTEEAAKKWNVTDRQVQMWCKANRIEGAAKLSRIWIIPDVAQKPTLKISKKSPHERGSK